MSKSPLVLATLLSLAPSLAFAGLCSKSSVDQASAVSIQTQKQVAAGVATGYDADEAEKTVLQLKLCINPMDMAAYSDLLANVSDRISQVKSGIKVGVATGQDLQLLEDEKTSVMNSCTAILVPSIAAQVTAGILAPGDLTQAKQACSAGN